MSILKQITTDLLNDSSHIAIMSGAFFPVIRHVDLDHNRKIDELVKAMMEIDFENS